MHDLSESKLFTAWTDPQSGLTSYILSQKVAPLQQSFYFVNDGMTRDGRYLWFYCAFPPSPERTLGVLDFDQQEIRHFPETQFSEGSPYVDPDSGVVYWCSRDAIWTRGPQLQDKAERVNGLPPELIGRRAVRRLATHLTRSADGKEFFVDAAIGLQWVFGSLPLDGGDFQLWQRFDRHFNHAQFSPTDPHVVLFAQEHHGDPITGLNIPIEDRMWLNHRGEQARPVFSEPTVVTHEWWDPDGRHVWCVKDRVGTWRVRLDTGEAEKIDWPGHWHSHADATGRYLVGDANMEFFRGCSSSVHFMNRDTGKHICIATNPEISGIVGKCYHIDPHPRFCGSDQFVVFTIVIRGEIEVCLVRTADLIDRTS